MTDEQLMDSITCCDPADAWDAIIANFEARSVREYAIAEEMRRSAKDAVDQTVEHTRRAEAFRNMAVTMENERPSS